MGHIAVKLPPFWSQRPDLWFAQAEASFAVSRVSRPETMRDYVIAALPPEVIEQISDLISSKACYTDLRDKLIARFSLSNEKKLRTLLKELTLGDRSPSQLLRVMREHSGRNVSDDALKSLWLAQLPLRVQTVISVSAGTVEHLATVADKVMETISLAHPSVVNSVQQDGVSELKRQIKDLEKRILQLTTHDRARSRSRSRSKDPKQPRQDEVCYFHRKFGNKARNCKTPCSYQGNANSRRT